MKKQLFRVGVSLILSVFVLLLLNEYIFVQNTDIIEIYQINYLFALIAFMVTFGTSFLAIELLGKQGLYDFLKDVYNSRELIWELAKNDLKKRYLGSYLGIIWAFIQPIITILVFWFVFQIGFKAAPVQDVPFILWLICGMIPWFFFNETIQGASSSIVDNDFLVKKIVFRVSVLPVIRIISALLIHLFFILIIFTSFGLYGFSPNIYNLQIIYYLFAMVILILGFSWLTSALTVFIKDMGHLIVIILQIGFWMTPIFWSYKIMPEKYQVFLKANPMFYIVEGYRSCFITHTGFWLQPRITIVFWVITLSIFALGILVFKKLKPHFADVL